MIGSCLRARFEELLLTVFKNERVQVQCRSTLRVPFYGRPDAIPIMQQVHLRDPSEFLERKPKNLVGVIGTQVNKSPWGTKTGYKKRGCVLHVRPLEMEMCITREGSSFRNLIRSCGKQPLWLS